MKGASGFVPRWVCQVELSRPLQDLVAASGGDNGSYSRARTLVRLHGQPIGFVDLPLVNGRATAAELAGAVRSQLGGPLASHIEADGLDGADLTERGLPSPSTPPCTEPGPHGEGDPHVTVVVPTRERAPLLRKCLDALLALDYSRFDVLVVDNAPLTGATAKLVFGLADPRVRYLVEPHRGISRARNHALLKARGDIVAFTDDDVTVDPGWLGGLVRGFTRAPDVACVTGFVVAAELESESQLLFDSRVSWSQSCEPRLFDLSSNVVDDPLYPYIAGAFGTGASFATSRSALEQLGPFDEALGAGAPPGGGEDLDFFLRVILSGKRIAYEPASVAWHLHRRDEEALRRQLFNYGSGLTAYAFKHLVSRGSAAGVRRRIPIGLRRLVSPPPASSAAGLPLRLRAIELSGAVAGPVAYGLGRGINRRQRAKLAAKKARTLRSSRSARRETGV